MNRSKAPEEAPIGQTLLLGVSITPLTIEDLMRIVDAAIDQDRRRLVIGHHNLHSISLYQRHPEMRAFYDRADFVFIDGMPIIAHAKLLGISLSREHRTTVLDWLLGLMEISQRRGWRVVFVGGTQEAASTAKIVLESRFPSLDLHVHHGYFDTTRGGEDNNSVLKFIQTRNPNILLVGMGMPRQEEWIAENLSALDANAILPIGAGMDYIAGVIATPPRWMGQIGLEWLYRLLSEPRRLAARYLVEPWTIVPLACRDYLARLTGRSG